LNSDKEAGSVSVLLTEGEIAEEQAKLGTKIDAETLRRKYPWGDSLCKGIWTDGEMAFDGLKIIPKCIGCNKGIEDYYYSLPRDIKSSEVLLEIPGGLATPAHPMLDEFQDVLASQDRVNLPVCQPLCWKPLLFNWSGADWYLVKANEEGEFMTVSHEERVWIDTSATPYSTGEDGRQIFSLGHEDISNIEMVFVASAGRDELLKRIAYGPAKAKNAIEEALIFLETKDPYSLMLDSVTKSIRKQGEAAYTNDELDQMKKNWEDAQSKVTDVSERKAPVVSEDLAREISGLIASCAGGGFGRECNLEELKTLIAGVERTVEGNKDKPEWTQELADTFDALGDNLTVAFERLEDEEEAVRQRYTHYLQLAYVEIEGLRMIAERP
jgi:hypothetical protein